MRFSLKLIAVLLTLTLLGPAQVTMGGGVSVGGGTLVCVPSPNSWPVTIPTYATAFSSLEQQTGWTADASSDISPNPPTTYLIVPSGGGGSTMTLETANTNNDYAGWMAKKTISVTNQLNMVIRASFTFSSVSGIQAWEVGRRETNGSGITDNGQTQLVPISGGLLEFDRVPAGGGWLDTGCRFPMFVAGTTYNEELYYVNGTDGSLSLEYVEITYPGYSQVCPIPSSQNPVAGSSIGFAPNEAVVAFQPDIKPLGAAYNAVVTMSAWTWTTPVLGTATPVLAPFAVAGSTGNTAEYPPSPVLNFQYQSPSTSSMAVPIAINNCSNSYNSQCSGSGSLTVTQMTISGPNASDFTLSGTTTGTLTAGQYLSPTVKFTPTAASGTAESATLSVVYSGAVVGSQTMALQGTSQTMTMLSTSACPTALASGTKYQLSANITCATTDFTEATNTNTYLNLAGHTLTYCNTPSSSLAAAVLMNGNSQGLHVYGGTITEPTGNLCTGTTAGSSYHYGSGWVINSSDGSSSGSFGTQLSLLTGNLNDAAGKVLFEENGNATTALSTSVTMVNFVDNSAYDCASVACRAGNQDYPILVYDAIHAAPSTFEMVGGVGGTQGGISSSAPSSVWEYNTLNPGSTTYTTSNGFAIQDWATTATVAYNQIFTNISTPCTSCRGIQIGSIVEAVTGSQIHDNYVLVTQLANNPEYGGCQGGGGYGIQLNTAGSGLDLSNNIIEHNTVIATDNACAGPAFSFSNATNANGPNQSISNHYEADLASSTSGIYPAQGMQFLAYEYSPAPNGSFVSTGDTILGDTSALNIAFDGTTTWTCTNCIFGKGTHPVASGWLLYDYYNGLASGNVGNGSGLFSIINPTFNAGASKALNNLSTWAHNNTASGMTGSYIIDWPYQVTVTGGTSGNPISSATVTVTDSGSTVECTATTNASGVAICPTLKDTLYQALSGAYTTPNYSPMGFVITKSGCTTNTYSETITGSITDSKTLSGC